MQQPQPLSPWQIWSLEVQNKLKEQQERIETLETQVVALCEQVKKLEAKPAYTIENIHYQFDQLKVEKLDGTLNIGMTVPGMNDDTFPGNIDQLAVSNTQAYPSAVPSVTAPSRLYNDIFAGMNRYLEEEAPNRLLAYENDLCIPLDPFHRRIIINDVRKQVPTRIQYYLQKSGQDDQFQPETNEYNTVTANVLTKTIRDADAALLAYMRQLQDGSPSSGGIS